METDRYATEPACEVAKTGPAEIAGIVEDITAVISRNSPYTDLSRAVRRIHALRAALGLDGDLRIVVHRNDPRLPDSRAPDRRLRHPAHIWASLTPVLEDRERLVLVSSASPQREREFSILALDFHRVARAREQGGERFQLTSTGRLVVHDKYHRSSAGLQPDDEEIRWLTESLSQIIKVHPDYYKAVWIAAVPGTEHAFSVLLGRAVAKCAKKPFVELDHRRKTTDNPLPFAVVQPAAIKKSNGILIDDVYRTGETWKAQRRP